MATPTHWGAQALKRIRSAPTAGGDPAALSVRALDLLGVLIKHHEKMLGND